MRTIASVFVIAVLAFGPSAVSAQGDKGHCHNKGPDGQLVEADDLDTQLACDEEGGTWFRQAQHCHKVDTNGKVTELVTVSSPKACLAKHGQWMDHRQTK